MRRVILIVLTALLALVSVAGCGGDDSPELAPRPETTVKQKPKPKKTGYQRIFGPSMNVRVAARPLCSGYAALTAQRSAQARTWLSETRGLQDPYAADEYLQSATWLHADHAPSFERAVRGIAKRRLLAVAANRRAVGPTIVQRFSKDSLFLCKQLASFRTTERLLRSVSTRGSEIDSLAAQKPWYPRGWYEESEGVAWRWIKPATCEYEGTTCWAIEVMALDGCESGLYAELQIQDANGTAIDYSNDSLGRLAPRQVGRLTFDWFNDSGIEGEGYISEINCY